MQRGITLKIFTITICATLLTVVSFAMAIIPSLKQTLTLNLSSESQSLGTAIKETTLTALATGDMATVVEQCFTVVSKRENIAYIVVSKPNNDSLVVFGDSWHMKPLPVEWPVQKIDEAGSFTHTSLFPTETFHYSTSLKHMGLNLGTLHIGLRTETFYEELQEIYITTSVIAVGVFLLGSLLSTLVARRITTPIIHLKRFAQETIQTGFQGRRIAISSGDEVEELAQVFNNLANSIEQTQEELLEAQDELEDRVMRRTQELSTANKKLTLMHEMFRFCQEGICITDLNGMIQEVNPAYAQITRMQPADVAQMDPLKQLVGEQDSHAQNISSLWDQIHETGGWEGEAIANTLPNPKVYHLSVSAIYGENDVRSHYMFLVRDISELKAKEQLIQHQANHDPLTGLPNRKFINDYIHSLIIKQQFTNELLAIFFVDLDNFKYINDTFGHSIGDELLIQVGKRLTAILRNNDKIGRLGGDEFIIVFSDLKDRRSVQILLNKTMAAFNHEFIMADGTAIKSTASCGVAMFPEDGKTFDQLLANSDMAMYKAKSLGKSRAAFYDLELHEKIRREYSLEQELKRAIAQDEFILHYQPTLCTKTSQYPQIEALVRWVKPDGTLVSPINFIPMAEEIGLIDNLTNLVFEKAFLQLATLNAAGWYGKLNVNISTRTLHSPNFLSAIHSYARKSKINLHDLEIEITESSLMQDIEAVTPVINSLRNSGISIALDDFGTGYSSLQYLAELPYQTLKIDRSFVQNMMEKESNRAIVESIISLATALDKHIVAEGVETQEQAMLLNKMNCHLLQGYFFCKPLPAEEIMHLLITSSQATA